MTTFEINKIKEELTDIVSKYTNDFEIVYEPSTMNMLNDPFDNTSFEEKSNDEFNIILKPEPYSDDMFDEIDRYATDKIFSNDLIMIGYIFK